MRTIITAFFAACLFIASASTAPAKETAMLDNGATFTFKEREYTNTAALVIFIKGGVARESAANNGIGSVFTRTWVKSSPLLEEIEFYGGNISANVGADYFEFSISIPTEHLPKLLDELSTLILSPTFSTSVFDRERALQLDEIAAQQDSPSSLSFRKFMETTYSGFPYALHSEGTTEGVSSLKPEDMSTYYQNLMEGANVSASLVGNVDASSLKKIRSIIERVPKGTPFTQSCEGSAIEKSTSSEMTDARIRQAKLYVGYTAPPANDENYAALKVVSDILGGGMSSRYFNDLRKEAGYAYSVGAVYPSRTCSSRFIAFIGTDEDRVENALSDIQQINETFADDLGQDELEKVKNYILGKMLIESQTNSRIAWYSSFFQTIGLGSDYFETYVDEIRSVTPADVKRVVKTFTGARTVFVLKPDPAAAEQE